VEQDFLVRIEFKIEIPANYFKVGLPFILKI